MRSILLIICTVLLSGCLGMPESVKPVSDFELNNYLGKWYEVARLDHSFERGLSQVTAEYRVRNDGGVSVLNRGYSEDKGEWKEAEGKAYFVDSPTDGYLKVSFFGPFYGSYVVFELERENYSYAFVSGPNTEYLWLLSRTPRVELDILEKFVQMSKERGFDTNRLIYVQQQ
ncbi:lipocalin family protein [Vibrio anguillarum]|jgi:apolipoprotein D and lipocalin family protein|uniref:lipocalin family protein n=2 Tax=Vibrio anguillarum TaxID=55601 RepID=UPI00097E34A2|nr:lipocalin family protein [Vibrio anguillarum]AQM21510.1 lipocalin [Vibrio anguillarum]AXM49354.1 lipocalin [Vibrio anguillarum]AXM52753.1 lipocalin [Vibrio anguillarum]AXM56038.1 lipocalin [Vibrio anguillarum]AXM58494.1 lipocalin [Vibrio anguillarum]